MASSRLTILFCSMALRTASLALSRLTCRQGQVCWVRVCVCVCACVCVCVCVCVWMVVVVVGGGSCKDGWKSGTGCTGEVERVGEEVSG